MDDGVVAATGKDGTIDFTTKARPRETRARHLIMRLVNQNTKLGARVCHRRVPRSSRERRCYHLDRGRLGSKIY